jgi:hypothetical protein
MAFFGRRNGLITAAMLQWCVCSLLLLSLGRAQGLAVGDAVWCVPVRWSSYDSRRRWNAHTVFILLGWNLVSAEGYIMDETCIVLETLIDNPSVRTLENPGVHSLHWYVEAGRPCGTY